MLPEVLYVLTDMLRHDVYTSHLPSYYYYPIILVIIITYKYDWSKIWFKLHLSFFCVSTRCDDNEFMTLKQTLRGKRQDFGPISKQCLHLIPLPQMLPPITKCCNVRGRIVVAKCLNQTKLVPTRC